MTSQLTGRDGRLLADTQMAAYSLGIKPASFRGWATRHHIKPVTYRPTPTGGQPRAMWDLADIADALDKQHALLDASTSAAHDQSQCT